MDSDTLKLVVDRVMWLFIPGPEEKTVAGSTIQEFQYYGGHPLKKTLTTQELNEFYVMNGSSEEEPNKERSA